MAEFHYLQKSKFILLTYKRVDIIDVSEEEIEKSLDFFFACAKVRRMGLEWKKKTKSMIASGKNVLPKDFKKQNTEEASN